MKIFIPPLNTKLILTAPWTVTLYYEYRQSLIEELQHRQLCPPTPQRASNSYYASTILIGNFEFPIGTELSVKRIYIRNGQKKYDSVTFLIKFDDVKGRLWVKLDEVNTMEADIVT